MNTTSKRCTRTRQPCFTPYTCGHGEDGCGISKDPHTRAAEKFYDTEAEDLIAFDSGEFKWLEPPRWPLWTICALVVAYGIACYFYPQIPRFYK